MHSADPKHNENSIGLVYLSHRRNSTAQIILRICTVWSEPSQLMRNLFIIYANEQIFLYFVYNEILVTVPHRIGGNRKRS